MSKQDRILIVEDENIVAVDIQDRLEHLGYNVVGHAVAGADAIDLAHEKKPDLVLMDIMLKGDMDGIDAAENIRRDLDIPVIFLTAYADQKTLQRAKITEPYGYILKPFEEREIHSTIEMAIYRHRIGKKLRESQLWLSAVLRSVAEAVITTDMDGVVTFLNPLAESIAGISQAGAIGKPLSHVLALLDEENRAEVDTVHSSGAGDTALKMRGYVVSSVSGQETPVSISSTSIRDERERTTGVVIVLQDITEQKKAEDDIRQAKERAELIYRVTPSAIFTVDDQCRITTWNDRAAEITGYTAEDAIGRTCWFFENGDCSKDCLFFPPGKKEFPLTSMPGTIKTKDGEKRFVYRNLDYLRSSTGELIGGIESFEDATERMQAEQEVRESELKFRSVIQTASDAIVMADSHGRVVSWNHGAEEIFGYSADEMLGQNVVRLMPERLQHLHQTGMERVARRNMPKIQGKTLELTGLRKDGTEFPLELSVTTWEAKGEVFASSIIRDISERKKAEEELESTLSELNIIFENATVGIAFILGGEIVRANRRFEEMFGYSRKELTGHSTELFFDSRDEFLELQDMWRKVLGSGETFMGENRLRRKDGSSFWCGLLGRSIDPADRTKGAIWIFEDITEQHKAREQLRAARDVAEQASRAKSEFLANMSHEIRTPMNGILGMVELIQETGLSQEQQEYVSIVKQSADNLLTLLNDILDFSKIEAGRLDLDVVPFDLRSTLYSTIKTLSAHARRKGLELSCDIDDDVPLQLMGDPGRLRQVIVNLLNNAIKFTSEGSIGVMAELVEEKLGRVGNDIVLRFTVRDTGIGIPREKHEHIFESFTQVDGSTTRKYGGTGLGLTISKQIVQLMGGDIWVESEPGKGSAFHFTARFKGTDVPTEGQADMGEAYQGTHVLLVGDNETGVDAISKMLQSWGFNTLSAHTQADVLETAHDALIPFDVVLMDCNMRGIEPRELVGHLKTSLRAGEASIVALMPPEAKNECEGVGVDVFLFKPFTASDLLDAITRALDERNKGAEEIAAGLASHQEDTGLRVLLAEDNPVNQKLVERMLRKEGVSLTIVNNGRDAVECLKAGGYQVVLMDVQMPEVDGIEATRQIRNGAAGAQNAGIPIVALTAHAMGGDRERFLAAGMNGYVSKPFKSFDIMNTLLRVLGKASRNGEEKKDESVPEVPAEGGDRGVLDVQGALALLDGDKDLLYEIWQDFIDEGQGWIELIGQAISSGDHKTVEREAHSMKSSSGSVGAEVLREIAYKLEVAGRERKKDEYMILFEQLKANFDEVAKAIREKLNRDQGERI